MGQGQCVRWARARARQTGHDHCYAPAALRALDKPVPRAAWAAGIAAARISGRMQAFERDGVQIRVDVGHNPQAAGQLARAAFECVMRVGEDDGAVRWPAYY